MPTKLKCRLRIEESLHNELNWDFSPLLGASKQTNKNWDMYPYYPCAAQLLTDVPRKYWCQLFVPYAQPPFYCWPLFLCVLHVAIADPCSALWLENHFLPIPIYFQYGGRTSRWTTLIPWVLRNKEKATAPVSLRWGIADCWATFWF